MRCVLVAAGLLVLAGGPFATADASDDDPATDPGCGNLAPLANTCGPTAPFTIGHNVLGGASILGFEGTIYERIQNTHGNGFAIFRCVALLVDQLSSACTLFNWADLKPGDEVVLTCQATFHPLSQNAVPPAGPWGCHITTW